MYRVTPQTPPYLEHPFCYPPSASVFTGNLEYETR